MLAAVEQSVQDARDSEVPGTKQVTQEIMGESAIKLDVLPSQVLANKILEHANEVIALLAQQSCFKIGQDREPAAPVEQCRVWLSALR